MLEFPKEVAHQYLMGLEISDASRVIIAAVLARYHTGVGPNIIATKADYTALVRDVGETIGVDGAVLRFRHQTLEGLSNEENSPGTITWQEEERGDLATEVGLEGTDSIVCHRYCGGNVKTLSLPRGLANGHLGSAMPGHPYSMGLARRGERVTLLMGSLSSQGKHYKTGDLIVIRKGEPIEFTTTEGAAFISIYDE